MSGIGLGGIGRGARTSRSVAFAFEAARSVEPWSKQGDGATATRPARRASQNDGRLKI